MANSPRMLKTMDEVLSQLGGTAAVMALTGIRTEQAVSEWKRRGMFAARYYVVMTQALAGLGLAADPKLWGQAEAAGTDTTQQGGHHAPGYSA